MGYRRPTSTASRTKARSSPTRTRSRAARRDAPRSSPGSRRSAPGMTQGRPAGRAGGTLGQGPDDRQPAQGAGLRDRPVRQEPPRRPQRVHPDGARLRRVLRQLLPPERRGGAGERRTIRRTRPSRRSSARAACSSAVATATVEHAARRPALRRRGASRSARTPARSRRSGWRPSTTRWPTRRQDFIEAPGHGEEALVRLVQHDAACTSGRTCKPRRHQGQDGPRRLRGRHDGARRPRRPDAEAAGRTRASTKDTIVIWTLGQRRRGDELAGRRHDTVPRREEHQLGGRLPRPAASCAGRA